MVSNQSATSGTSLDFAGGLVLAAALATGVLFALDTPSGGGDPVFGALALTNTALFFAILLLKQQR